MPAVNWQNINIIILYIIYIIPDTVCGCTTQTLGSITQSGSLPSNILGVQVTEILLMLGPMIFPADATGKILN